MNPKSLGVKDIAKLANVSIGTVDRVLHNREGVSLKTKEKILAIIKQYNYEPNIIAQSLTKKNIKYFKAIIPKSSKESTYWQAPLQGIRDAIEEIKKYGIEVEILLFDQNDIASFNALQENLNFNELHGLLIAPMFKQETLALISKCEENAIPYVLINSDLSKASPIGYFGPDLYQSGLVAANLIQYSSAPQESILIVNISKELYPEHHLYIKQEAFISYFKPHKKRQIHTLDIRSTESEVINRELHRFFEHHKVRVIFVTNSRVSSVASYLKSKGLYEDILLIGFDYLEDNLQYLEENVIDFLICHKPIQQGYQALLSLFNYVKFGKKGVQKTFMPIDIISQYNYKYYDN